MYLKRLEIQGFKTFAVKTVLEFQPDANGRSGLTAVVGPNGSGKSNVADAIRWVMGEQSMKLLRGKKSEDVIFSGSDKKPRSGFAEVTMTLENDDRPELDMAEVVITRRLYRDGQSEYEVNRQAARLTDVALLLAQCGIGQRTYSVIGQGMVDEVLASSPTERKVFFDEAAGLRPFQLKRHASVNKLEGSHDNLRQTEALLREIGPRLTSLERQVKRLEQREALEAELKDLETKYYGGTWRDLRQALERAVKTHKDAVVAATKHTADSEKLEAELAAMEKAVPQSEGFGAIRESLDRLSEERSRLRERQMRLETKREVAAVRAEKPWAPLPLTKIIEAIDQVQQLHEKLVKAIDAAKPDLDQVKKLALDLRERTADLVSKLQRPAPEPEQTPQADPEIVREMAEIAAAMAEINKKTFEAQQAMEQWNKTEEKKRSHLFQIQHDLSRLRQEQQAAERRVSEAAVELARVETRRDAFLQDAQTHVGQDTNALDGLAERSGGENQPEAHMPRIVKLRAQLEWIGGIDPETLKEYGETKKRYDELNVQVQDLTQAIASLETIVKELDQTIAERSKASFRELDREFGLYFKKLFNGGEAKLLEVYPEPEFNEQGELVKDVDPNAGPTGIEITATPPGKRLKAIALLSGGERALTSIALICAIMATNPSPFVVLDEVDAALDESNSSKFAEIVSTLSDRTQFVIVTHNRATMNRAHILYGVTMGSDGVSQLLSVKLQDVIKNG